MLQQDAFINRDLKNMANRHFFDVFIHQDMNDADEAKQPSSQKGTQMLAKESNFEKEDGDRACVTLRNGMSLWYHGNDIYNFIQASKGDDIGEAYKSLEKLMKVKIPLAGARALLRQQ